MSATVKYQIIPQASSSAWGDMLPRVQSLNLDKATIALAVVHERHDLLRAIWENPVLPLLTIEDPYIFGACSRKAFRFYLESMPGIPEEILRLWLVAFPYRSEDHNQKNLFLWAHVGHYWIRGQRPVWQAFAVAGSQLMVGVEASRKLLGWESETL